MPFIWLLRRSLHFTLVRLFRLRNFLWRFQCRQSPERFVLRLRANGRTRPWLESIDSLLLLSRLAMKRVAGTPKTRRLLALAGRATLLVLLFLLCFTFNMPWQTQHLAVISSNYFPPLLLLPPEHHGRPVQCPAPLLAPVATHLYGENSISNGPNATFAPKGLSQNGTNSLTSLAKVRYAFTPIMICGWTVYLAVCPTVDSPALFSLRDVQVQSQPVAIPYRRTSVEKFSVVACFSPLFYNERWQLIIPTLEIYRQFGVSLQVYYIQSMLVEILDFMRAYERAKVVRLAHWTRLNVTDPGGLALGYDPNAELEWRNQAASHTDCLLHYKVGGREAGTMPEGRRGPNLGSNFLEAAEFLIVSDLDDVLIPKMGRTFLEEFRLLTTNFPSAAGFNYNRYNTELVTSSDPADFSLAALINEARVATEWEDPKYVVRPSHVQSVWLHWPGIIDRGSMHVVPNEENFMFHLRNWSMIDFGSSSMPRLQRVFKLFKYQMADIIRPEAASKLDQNFHKFLLDQPELLELFGRLPQRVLYYPIIAACYNRIFYGRHKRPVNCPGPLRCALPPLPGVRCAIATRQVGHAAINKHLVVHYPVELNATFEISNSGCTI